MKKLDLNYKILLLILVAICGVALTSCGSAKYPTLYAEQAGKKTTTATNVVEWINEKLNAIEDGIDTSITNLEVIIDGLVGDIDKLQAEYDALPDGQEKANKAAVIAGKEEELTNRRAALTEYSTEEYRLKLLQDEAVEIAKNYINYEVVSNKKDTKKIDNNYKVILMRQDVLKYIGYIESATVAVKDSNLDLIDATVVNTSCFGTTTNVKAMESLENIEQENDVYRIITIFTIQYNVRNLELEPLIFYTGDQFMSHLFNNFLVFPIGWMLYFISKIFGGYYIIGLIISTLIVRTIGWPIYAKTNDMTLKMQMAQPELAKIDEKYANRKDPDSQRMMQMEKMQVNKKYGVGIGGCLMPFLQFPIFMAVFRAVSRLPYTVTTADTPFKLNWAADLKPNFLTLNLFNDRTSGTGQMIGIIIIMILVVATQFISQKLSEKRQKETQAKKQENIPAYRRQATSQEGQMQSSMKIMMYMMMLMMGVFVWTSKAALGIYWLIGNLYSMAQTFINSKTSSKRMAKMEEKMHADKKKRGR